MAIKSSEQLAQDIMDEVFDPEGTGTCDVTEVTDVDVYTALVKAIEADRAQRQAQFTAELSQIIEFLAEDKSNDWTDEVRVLTELESAL